MGNYYINKIVFWYFVIFKVIHNFALLFNPNPNTILTQSEINANQQKTKQPNSDHTSFKMLINDASCNPIF